MEGIFISFILSTLASIIAYYICKWLKKQNKRRRNTKHGGLPPSVFCTQMELEFLFLLLYLKYTTTFIPCQEPTQIRFFHSSIRICQKAIVRRFHV